MSTGSLTTSLRDLGWDDDWAAALAGGLDPAAEPGRVSRVDRGISTVLTAEGPVRVAAVADLRLAVGDWVALAPAVGFAAPAAGSAAPAGGFAAPAVGPQLVAEPAAGSAEPAAGFAEPAAGSAAPAGQLTVPPGHRVLVAILPRRCAFRRVSDDAAAREQVVAANIDTVLLVTAIDGQLSVRHLERYVALAFQSGAVPVIVITKADLAPVEEVAAYLADVSQVAPDVAVHIISAATGAGLDQLVPYLAPGRTLALLGLSGAGKSTLVNLLAGAQILATGAVRGDGKGRHTTTYRELVPIPGGGLVIDTPGMRALSVSTASDGVAQVFADIEELEGHCGFPNCSHTTEEGCAVQAAVAAGDLNPTRVASWRQLRRETPEESPQVTRLRVVERKRQKASDKAGRARSRAIQKKLVTPPPPS